MDYNEAKYSSVRRKGSTKQWCYQYHNDNEVFVTDDNSNRSMFITKRVFDKYWELVK